MRAIRKWGAFLLVLALLPMVGCKRTPPEQAVRTQLDALQAAVEARDAAAVSALLSNDFIGNDGLDKRGARQLAAGMFLRYRTAKVRFGPVRVSLRGEGNAVASFSVVASGGDGSLLPQDGQLYQVETGWRLEGSDWRLVNASWKPAL